MWNSSISGLTGGSMKLSGLASGLDTDQIISDLMKVEKLPLDRLSAKRQLAEWRRDSYREITNLLRGLKDEYFNVLKPSSNMLSQSVYKNFSVTSSDSSVVTASANADAADGIYSILVNSLATADKATSTEGVTKALTGTPTEYALSGKSFKITLDGVTRELELGDYADLDDLVAGVQQLADDAFGAGKISVMNSSGELKFETTGGATKITLGAGTTDDALALMGFTSGDSNRLNTSKTLEELSTLFDTGLTFDASDNLVFTINSKQFTFSKTTSLASMMSTINGDATANVKMVYDEVTDTFNITSKQTGAGDNISISQTGGTFFDGSAKISTAAPVTTEGTDASVVINGETITRSSNIFTLNGITYTLSAQSAEAQTITVSSDVDGVYESIKGFVEKYNEVIETINDRLSEKRDRDYIPLTDEQKEEMSETEIELWEKKAKEGLLRSDSILQNIVRNMRSSLFESVPGTDLTLFSIGISTGSYTEGGKLNIDEDKLKEAIAQDPDGVMNLFSKKSETYPNYSRNLTSEERAARYSEQGLAYRLFDIIEDNISTTRDSSGNKGLLLEKAGISGDLSEFNNSIYREISNYSLEIEELQEKLYNKEDAYYKKFTAMETALYQMNAQSEWIATQFNSMYQS